MANHTPGAESVVILVGGTPVSNVNPLPTSGGGGGSGTVTAGSSSAAFSAAAMTTAPRPAPSFSYITSATTTAVKTSAGVIRSIEITAPFTAGSLTVYNANNAATNPIASFGWGLSGVFLRNLSCSNGITVVTGEGFNGQVTVTYE